MAGVHKFSGSFSHSGSTAQFISGVSSSGVVTGAFIGNGSLLTNLQFGTSQINLFFGSESLSSTPTYGNWIKRGEGPQEILLSTSSSNGAFNHFTFLKLDPKFGWIEESDYTGTQNGIASNNTLSQTLGTGVYEYLLLAMSTASKETVTAGATVIINPELLE
tara:strand:+ start:261 stop:746 length:486 start_codon:yes stop_codon:yes gene_type:complete